MAFVYVKLVRFFSWFLDAFRSSSIKYLFCQLQKRSIFIRKWVGNQRNNDLKTINILWIRLQIRSKIVQGTFWRPSGAPWGAQGVPDWILGVKSWFVGPPLDPQMGSIFRPFCQCKIHLIFCCFFGCILEGFCIHFESKNASKMGSEMEHVCFLFWASRVGES